MSGPVKILVVGLAVSALALVAAPGGAQAVQPGGSATFLAAGDVDFLDPGQTYYTFGYAVQFAVNRSLYGFPAGATAPAADLASGPPEVSADAKTVTVRLKPGIRYAPPLDRTVRADDIKYAIERAFSSHVPSGYASTYFSDLVGAPHRPGAIRPVIGVEAPDDLTVLFHLKHPTGTVFAEKLVLPITIPVPREYAAPFDAHRITTYERHVAYTGPYVVTSRSVGKRIQLARNPNWDASTDFRPAYLDTITIDEGHDDTRAAIRRTLSGSRLLCCDSTSPPVSQLRAPGAQVARVPAGGTRWIALNTHVKPFDRLNVRRAVVAGMNRSALRATRGGARTGALAQHYLPPGIPGYAESHGKTGFGADFMANPGGNRRLSRRYFRRAGFRRGHYTGRRRLLMVGTNADPGRETARVAARQLRRMGFRLKLKLVPQDVLYTRYCGVPRRRVAICPNVGWFEDFLDPEALLRSPFSGKEIRSAGNVNWSQLNVPSINHAIDSAGLVAPGPARNAAWAAVNRAVTRQAPGVPYSWDYAYQFASADLEAVVNRYSTVWDLTATGLRG